MPSPRSLPRRGVAACLLPLVFGLVAACASPPPPASVATPWGLARAGTSQAAADLAELLSDLGPRVRALLPGSLDRPTEVWLDDFGGDERLADRPAVLGLTAYERGHIRIRADRWGRDADFVLAHELVHALLGPTWDPLPAALKEGLCDAVALRLVPAAAERVRATRLFDAAAGLGGPDLELVLFEPGLGVRERVRLPVSARRPVDPVRALAVPGRGVHLHDAPVDAAALYGYGLLLAERLLDRIGVDGLHGLCLEAGARGRSVVPAAWILTAADLPAAPAAWRRQLLEQVGPGELRAQCAQLSAQLAAWLVSRYRGRFPELSGEAFLDRVLPTLGWEGGDVRLALGTVEVLRTELARRWDGVRPAPLHPGEGFWRQDGTGLHLTSLLPPSAQDPWVTITTLDLGPMAERPTPEQAARSLPLTPDTRVEAVLEVGRDGSGAFVRARLPRPFAAFRVEAEGQLLADLSLGRNATSREDGQGWWEVTCRLPGERLPEGLVLHHPASNLVISLRGAGTPPGSEQVFPMRLPWAR